MVFAALAPLAARLSAAAALCALLFLQTAEAAALPVVAVPHLARRRDGHGSPQYSAVVAFGDSFTDNGNGSYRVSSGTWPALPEYYHGRFSNNLVWVEYVAGNLSAPLYDYAIGGATTSNGFVQGYTGPGSTIPVSSVDEQVRDFVAAPPAGINGAEDNLLFVLLGGANDIFFNVNATAAQSYAYLMQSMDTLQQSYPSASFLLLNYPDLAHLPYGFYASSSDKVTLSSWSAALHALLQGRALKASSAEDVTYVNLAPLFDDFDYYAAPGAYGFDPLGAYGSCLVGAYMETPNVTVCPDFDAKVFMDEYHPTSHAHSWIAKQVLDALD